MRFKPGAAEAGDDYTTRLALQEAAETLPFRAVGDAYCKQQCVAVGDAWLAEVNRHGKNVLHKRN